MFVFLGGQAVAQEIILGRDGSSNVFVWQDREAQKRALHILQTDGGATQQNVGSILKQTACVVPTGTPAKIIRGVSASYLIEVIGTDCVGVIQKEDAN